MSTCIEYDAVIIGAGVLGTTTARRMMEFFPGRSVAVLEQHTASGLETSSRNSGVLHSGFHQEPNSYKARFAKIGHALARDFAKKHNVPMLDRCGMVIAVPTSEMLHPRFLYEEVAFMWHLLRRGKKHDIDFEILTGIGIKKLEPNIRATLGVFIPNVSVIDSLAFVQALECDAVRLGAHFFYENEVKDIRFEGNHTVIVTTQMTVRAKVVINAAGLYADEIANHAFGKKLYTQYPWRGEYYEVINPEKRGLVTRLVYPVVSSKHPGKGIHFSPRPDGRLFLGPNARRVSSKTCYDEDRTPKEEFLHVPNAFGAGLLSSDIQWAYSGIRPKLSDKAEEDDFHIGIDSEYPLFINLMGIESPGLSSSMALAKYICAYPELLRILQ